jgi:hypothetical protein
VKQRNVGAFPCFGSTEIFPSFCESDNLLAHDLHIDKPKPWYQQKKARSHVYPADVYLPAFTGTPTAFDFAITAPQRQESLALASRQAGAAAEAYTRHRELRL